MGEKVRDQLSKLCAEEKSLTKQLRRNRKRQSEAVVGIVREDKWGLQRARQTLDECGCGTRDKSSRRPRGSGTEGECD